MNPILMSLSSVQSLTHDHRVRFEPRLLDRFEGIEGGAVEPRGVVESKGFVGRLTSWLKRNPLPALDGKAIIRSV